MMTTETICEHVAMVHGGDDHWERVKINGKLLCCRCGAHYDEILPAMPFCIGTRVVYIGSNRFFGLTGTVERETTITEASIPPYQCLVVRCDDNPAGVRELSGNARFFESEE
jgi:hypothetical protein